MDQKALERYARLMVQVGANVQPGQWVRLTACVDQVPLVKAVTEECYRAGAARVELFWECGEVSRLHYQYASTDTLGTVRPWEEARAAEMTEQLPVRIFIESADPDELAGIPADVLSTVAQLRGRVLKKYRDAIDGRHQWLIVAAASPAWAKKVFPDLPETEAVERLWQAIFACTYMDRADDPVAIWRQHTAEMTARAEWLNRQQLRRLEYKSANGTDFSVELIPGAKWGGAGDTNHENGAFYVPNMPTEEVFTSPMRGKCSGRLVATKPLSWSGQLIEDFTVDFTEGRVSGCTAKTGEEILRKMFAMDEGASMLGELALVPKESPINRCGFLFYNTLFDENACCHVAVGKGFGEVLEGFTDMTQEELTARGINDSLIHVDFMVGSEDLAVTGYREDGSSVAVFRDGTWAFSLE